MDLHVVDSEVIHHAKSNWLLRAASFGAKPHSASHPANFALLRHRTFALENHAYDFMHPQQLTGWDWYAA